MTRADTPDTKGEALAEMRTFQNKVVRMLEDMYSECTHSDTEAFAYQRAAKEVRALRLSHPPQPAMGEVERLVKKLRDWAPGLTAVRKDCLEAADMIERLAALSQPPAVATPAADAEVRGIDEAAFEYAAEYAMSTEGADYAPTGWERELILDALQGFISEHWSAASPKAPAVAIGAGEVERERDEARQIVRDIYWMARRYADGRQSYAVGMFNDAVRKGYDAGWLEHKISHEPPFARDSMFSPEWKSVEARALEAETALAAALTPASASIPADMERLRPFAEWHEDHRDVLWWKLPINQPPYVGSPLDLGCTMKVVVQIGVEEHDLPYTNTGGWPFDEDDEASLYWSRLPNVERLTATLAAAPTPTDSGASS